MEALSNLQFNLQSTISKARSNFKKSPKERLTSSYIETRLENLEANWSAFFETHRKIVSSVKSIEYEKSEYNLKNVYETTEELFTEYKAELREALKKIVCSDSSAKDNHKLANCKRFAGLDIEKRRNFVQTNGLCYNCLGANHSVYACRQSSRCHICKRKHHSLLHLKNVSKSGGDSNNPDQVVESSGSAVTTSNQSNSTNIVSCFANSHSQILLATALIVAESKSGTAIVLRSLLDQGSQASFVTESAVQLLGLKRIPTKGSISGIGCDQEKSSISLNSMVLIKVKSRIDPSFIITVKAYVLKKLTTILPERKVYARPRLTLKEYQCVQKEWPIVQETKIRIYFCHGLISRFDETENGRKIGMKMIDSYSQLISLYKLHQKPGIDTAEIRYPNSTNAELILSPTLTRGYDQLPFNYHHANFLC
ncbi:hypothetical protein HF086_003786 [Spodoptera exigua]|uniref:Peptidase aspartic putative domain-containing protein n=1 Tax=Spodoptera exigua TaxID=7107 RepID=A0A922MXH4_SPOEX|nr:hypothetical protein HF086_003786 [Spodoptera exigua]